ncbi:MAG: hypothetical protein AAF298_08380 [Cyanobacteria bacterium P01_A01_bin.40]
MSKIFSYAIALPLVYAIIASVFSVMVAILNLCFPGSLEGTYLKLFF